MKNWHYDKDLSAIVEVRDHKVKVVADFGKIDNGEENAKNILAGVAALAEIERLKADLRMRDALEAGDKTLINGLKAELVEKKAKVLNHYLCIKAQDKEISALKEVINASGDMRLKLLNATLDALKVELSEAYHQCKTANQEHFDMGQELESVKAELADVMAKTGLLGHNKDYVKQLEKELAALKAQPAQSEPVYAYRRKGQDAFSTCDEARYIELSDKPHLFEMAVFYTTPQPAQSKPVAYIDESIRIKWIIDHDKASKLIGTKLYTTPQPAQSEPCDRQCSEYQNAECPGDPGKQCCMEKPAQSEPVYVIFDGPPEHRAPGFIEVEDEDGFSVGGFTWEPHCLADCWRLGPFYTTPQPSVEVETLTRQRDTAWEELRKIRQSVSANDEESTFDEVVRLAKQRDELANALELLVENTEEPPDRNCSCHISPPCSDCVDFSCLREALAESRAALASAKGEK